MITKETTYRSELYVEWCSSVDRRGGHLLPLLSLESEKARRHNPGFRSVYCFDQVAYEQITSTGSSRGFRQYVPYSDTLVIDLDNGDKDLERLIGLLKGYSFRVFSSGSKGFHVEIDTPLYCGHELPQAHREFVETLGVAADTSLYRHSSLVAIEGRIHPKTGRRKSLLNQYKGELLSIPKPTKALPITVAIRDEDADLAWLFTRLATVAASEPTQGWRHTTLWSVSESMSRIGLNYETAIDLLTRINESWQNPKPQDEVERAVKQAYTR